MEGAGEVAGGAQAEVGVDGRGSDVGADEGFLGVDVDAVEAGFELVERVGRDGAGGGDVELAPVAEDRAEDVHVVGGESELIGSHGLAS